MNVILKVLGISHIRNMLVGSGELRGISGGERRRLSIALELVNLPSVMFAQQPTNGLDSANALTLVQYCKVLAVTAQRSMVMTLVQPSPQLLLQFGKVPVITCTCRLSVIASTRLFSMVCR